MTVQTEDEGAALLLRSHLFAEHLGHLLRTAKHVHDLTRGASSRQPLTPPQFAVLLAVARVPGSDQATIARLAALDKSSTSEILRRLSRQSKVRLERDSDDGRRLRVFASADAIAQVEMHLADLRRVDEALLNPLPAAQCETLLDALHRLAYFGVPDPSGQQLPEVDVVAPVSEASSALGRLLRVSLQTYNSLWRKHAGIERSPVAHEFLRVIHSETAGVPQNIVGLTLLLDRASIAGLANRLSRAGSVTAQTSDRDRRRKVLRLTPDGLRSLHDDSPGASATERSCAEVLGKQWADVLAGLRAVVDAGARRFMY